MVSLCQQIFRSLNISRKTTFIQLMFSESKHFPRYFQNSCLFHHADSKDELDITYETNH